MKYMNKIIAGDCEKILKDLPDNSIDLIFTSPPYADRRKKTYGGTKANDYVEWFLPKSEEFFRVLKPSGSFVLNIKEKVEKGERHTYVIKLILALKQQGWLWTEEYIWHKKNSFPGKWPNRFRDGWERLLHFNKAKKFNMYQDAVRVPIGSWANHRMDNLSETDKKRDESRVKSGFGKNVSNWAGRDTVYPNNVIETPENLEYPSNVLKLATETTNQNHSAAFPIYLPEWFIKLFTVEGDIVLDPFMGSGTTAVSAKSLNRHYIGVEINEENCNVSRKRLESI